MVRKYRTFENIGTVYCVSFSPDGKTIASGGAGSFSDLWDVGTGSRHRTLQGHKHMVFSFVFSPDGKTIASGSADENSFMGY